MLDNLGLSRKVLLRRATNVLFRLLSGSDDGKRAFVDRATVHLSRLSYLRLRELGFVPGGIIDVGAHQGEWIREVAAVFPETPALMIEAREEQKPSLMQVVSELRNASVEFALLGSERREGVRFSIAASGSSLFDERSNASRTYRDMQMKTLDDIVRPHSAIKAPLLLKLDVQGAELEVLRGGLQTLQNAAVVQLEVALLNYNEGAPLILEVMQFMDQQGFAMYDLAGLVRPGHIHLAQIDALFVRKTSKLRASYFEVQ